MDDEIVLSSQPRFSSPKSKRAFGNKTPIKNHESSSHSEFMTSTPKKVDNENDENNVNQSLNNSSKTSFNDR